MKSNTMSQTFVTEGLMNKSNIVGHTWATVGLTNEENHNGSNLGYRGIDELRVTW